MIARCHRCWGSKELEDMFTCLNCENLFCKTHKGLPGLLLCIKCFELGVARGENQNDECTEKID